MNSISFVITPQSSINTIKNMQWIRNPKTGEKETIIDAWYPCTKIPCPKCQTMDKHILVVTAKHIILGCKVCNDFLWCKRG